MNVIEAAKAAGASVVGDDPQCWIGDIAFEEGELERFAQIIRNQALEDAAVCCDERFAVRAGQGLPREASSARALADAIRAMKKE